MNATAVEKINTEPTNPVDPCNQSLPPRTSHHLRRILFAVIAFIILLTVLIGLVQKWLWMRQLDYVGIFWTLLSVNWGMFVVALVFGFMYPWINLHLATKTIDVSQKDGSFGRLAAALADASRRIEATLNPKLLVLAADVGIPFVSLIFAIGVSAQAARSRMSSEQASSFPRQLFVRLVTSF
jgi:uncharacterized membrane protein (UPF0182 family)